MRAKRLLLLLFLFLIGRMLAAEVAQAYSAADNSIPQASLFTHNDDGGSGTGEPPVDTPNCGYAPSGRRVIGHTPQAVPPSGVPSLTNGGIITVVPKGRNKIAVINVGSDITLFVRSNRYRELVVRAEFEPVSNYPSLQNRTLLDAIEIDGYRIRNNGSTQSINLHVEVCRNVPKPRRTHVYRFNENAQRYRRLWTYFHVSGGYVGTTTTARPHFSFVFAERNTSAQNTIEQTESVNMQSGSPPFAMSFGAGLFGLATVGGGTALSLRKDE
ncbi:MAG: hypothetical protein ACPG8W_01040 [Candidatus Promineifilaceae bacterium]